MRKTKTFSGNSAIVRTTAVFPTTLDRNLTLFCAQAGLSKTEVIKKAVTAFLIDQGLQPDKEPKSVKVTY